MVSYNISSIKTAEHLVQICRKFPEDIDVIYQRQIIDGKNILGVYSLIGNIVGVDIITDNEKVKEKLADLLKV